MRLYAESGPDQMVRLDLTAEQVAACEVLTGGRRRGQQGAAKVSAAAGPTR